jgi:hypothetical protein
MISRVAWIVGLAATAVVGVGAAVLLTRGSSSATPSSAPGTPPGQVPVWSQLTPVANPSNTSTYMVSIPAGSTFAFSDVSTDPNLATIVAGLNQAAGNGTVAAGQTYQVGTAAPSFWPQDGMGTSAYRTSGVAQTAFNLSLGPLSGSSPATGPQVWVVTGYQPAPPAPSTITLAAGNTTSAVPAGTYVTLILPQGATWAGSSPVSLSNANLSLNLSMPPSGSSNSLLVTYNGGGSVLTATWNTSAGVAQTSTITFNG